MSTHAKDAELQETRDRPVLLPITLPLAGSAGKARQITRREIGRLAVYYDERGRDG